MFKFALSSSRRTVWIVRAVKSDWKLLKYFEMSTFASKRVRFAWFVAVFLAFFATEIKTQPGALLLPGDCTCDRMRHPPTNDPRAPPNLPEDPPLDPEDPPLERPQGRVIGGERVGYVVPFLPNIPNIPNMPNIPLPNRQLPMNNLNELASVAAIYVSWRENCSSSGKIILLR